MKTVQQLTDKEVQLQKKYIKKNGKPIRHNDLDIKIVSLSPKQMHSSTASDVSGGK